MSFIDTNLSSDANLEGYWKCDSNILLDSSSNGRDVTKYGTVVSASGKFTGGANGASSGCLAVGEFGGTLSDLDVTSGAFTMLGWFKMNTDIASGAQTVMVKSNSAVHIYSLISYQYNSGAPRLWFYRDKGGGVGSVDHYHTITLGTTWHQIGMSYDGTTVRYIVDGSEVSSDAQTGVGTAGYSTYFSFLADNDAGGYGSAMNAIADDVVFFSRRLSAAEITTVYTSPLDPPEPGGFIYISM